MSHSDNQPTALALTLAVSNRLQAVAVTLLMLMSLHFVVASCSPEPVPYASRVLIQR